MIVHSFSYSLTAPESNSPVFGMDNLVTTSNVVVNSQNGLYPITNVANNATNLEWRSAGSGTIQIEIDTLIYNQNIDYVAFARHNFKSANIQVQIQTVNMSNVTVTDVPYFFPSSDEPLLIRITAGVYKVIRIMLSVPVGAVARAAVIRTGKLLVSPRRVYVGHSPINLSVVVEATNGRSEIGNFLGRIITQESSFA